MHRNITHYSVLYLLLGGLLASQQSCSFKSWRSFAQENEYGRVQLKPEAVTLKTTFDPSAASRISTDKVYHFYKENTGLNTESLFTIRFFPGGQYAFFAQSISPIAHRSHNDYNFNELNKASHVGYYNIKGDEVVLEYPNLQYSRSGKSNLDSYKILPNGDLQSLTTSASDYEAVYKKVSPAGTPLVAVSPDW